MKQSGLVIATIAGVLILLGLGAWQFHRLQWKTDLLETVEVAATAPPITSIEGLETLREDGEPVDFRRIAIDVQTTDLPVMFRRFRGDQGGLKWERFVPVAAGGHYTTVFTGYDIVDDGVTDIPDVPNRLFGHVRAYDAKDLKGGNYSIEGNRYYGFNPDMTWSEAMELMGVDIAPDYYIDADPAITDAGSIPVRRPDIRNNHLQYMLTWWSFAIVLIIISSILYRRRAAA